LVIADRDIFAIAMKTEHDSSGLKHWNDNLLCIICSTRKWTIL